MNDPPIKAVEPVQEIFRGRLIRVASQRMRFSNGTEKTFEFAERAPGVRILLTDGEHILLTKEWRSETETWDYRLPGGKVFDSLHEYLTHKEAGNANLRHLARFAAQKELLEETSIRLPLDTFIDHHHSVCGATVVWDLYYYLVVIGRRGPDLAMVNTHEGEQTHPQWITCEEVLRLCLTGQVQEDRTVAVLLRYLLAKPQGSSS